MHLNAPCRRFVTSSKDGDARIWDTALKKCVICLSGHTLAVTCVKWGGDGVIYTGYASLDFTFRKNYLFYGFFESPPPPHPSQFLYVKFEIPPVFIILRLQINY